jgi:hypothetical protein
MPLEAEAREEIDRQLAACGRVVQDYAALNLAAAAPFSRAPTGSAFSPCDVYTVSTRITAQGARLAAEPGRFIPHRDRRTRRSGSRLTGPVCDGLRTPSSQPTLPSTLDSPPSTLRTRDVRSAAYFEQMKGRGCRIIDSNQFQQVTSDAKHKTRFVIVDAVGVCHSDKITSKPLDRKPTVSLEKLLDTAKTGAVDADVVSTLAANLNKRLEDCQRQTTFDDAVPRRIHKPRHDTRRHYRKCRDGTFTTTRYHHASQ